MRKSKHLFFLFFLCISTVVYSVEKYALIVAIGDYPSSGGWHKLNSVNDERIIRETLYIQGFKKENIRSLINHEATKRNIVDAFNLLIEQTTEGDIVVFHFSGHGQQITDLNGDEVDGYDEALIPYDAYKTNINEYKGEKHLIDDELNIFLYQLRKKAGITGDVIFMLDACHSGTATRGLYHDAIFRGTNYRFELDSDIVYDVAKNKLMFDEQNTFEDFNRTELSPYAVISASGQQELNIEIDAYGKQYGSLSYAIAETLNNTTKELSYLTFFENIQSRMSILIRGRNIQTPQFEGKMNRLVFGGKAVDIHRSCRVIEVINSQRIKVNMGQLSGLSKGDEISFYPPDTYDTNSTKPIVKGEVTGLELYESFIRLKSLVSSNEIELAWGFVTNWVSQNDYSNINEMRADIIRKATASDKTLDVKFKLVQLDQGTKNDHALNLFLDEMFYLKIINEGTKTAFFQIITIQSDNKVSLLFDPSRLTPNELIIEPGNTKYLNRYPIKVVPPVGLEMYKLVASEQQLDLSPIITQRYIDKRALNHTGFEQLINELYKTDNIKRSYSTKSGINIYTRTFSIKE